MESIATLTEYLCLTATIQAQAWQSGNSIDLSRLPAGLYILQFKEKGKLYSARVAKE